PQAAGRENHSGLGPRRQAPKSPASPSVAQQTPKETLRRLQLLAVVRGQTGTSGVQAPPALEAPQSLVGHAKPRDPTAAPTGVAGLEVEEALEYGGGGGALGAAFPAVGEEDAGRGRAELLRRSPGAPPGRAAREGGPGAAAAGGPP